LPVALIGDTPSAAADYLHYLIVRGTGDCGLEGIPQVKEIIAERTSKLPAAPREKNIPHLVMRKFLLGMGQAVKPPPRLLSDVWRKNENSIVMDVLTINAICKEFLPLVCAG
jgi:hypothetical protein